MFSNPFFHLKIGRFKATVHRVAHPSMLKQGGFCYDSASNPLAILGTSRNGLGDVGIPRPAHKKARQNLPVVAYRAKPLGPTVGISRTAQRDMPMVSTTIL
jgi:hypothetical protein